MDFFFGAAQTAESGREILNLNCYGVQFSLKQQDRNEKNKTLCSGNAGGEMGQELNQQWNMYFAVYYVGDSISKLQIQVAT
jgi:hypothetical protein